MPLRPLLYERLCRRFAREGGVQIADDGCQMQYTVVTNPSTGRPHLDVAWSEEYYIFSCPYCDDTRGRLWVNHRWGYLDPETQSRNL